MLPELGAISLVAYYYEIETELYFFCSKQQWVSEKEKFLNLFANSPSRMMLHSDMGMKINFNVVKQTGQPSCRIVKGGNARQEGSCPQTSQFLPAVSIWVERRGKMGETFIYRVEKIFRRPFLAIMSQKVLAMFFLG